MAEHVYYNINIPYDPTRGCDNCVATIQYESGDTVLDRGSDYYASIINFSLPVSSVPLSFVDIESFPNTDVNKTVYKVALEYNGNVSTQNLIFYSSDLTTSPPNAPTATNTDVKRTMYHAVYTYTKFLNMLNIALKAAFDALPAKPVGSASPTITFNSTTNRFSMNAAATYYKSDLAQPIKIYMGYKLYQFFVGFNVDRVNFQAADARDFRFVFLDSSGAVEQDYSTISNWNCLRSLQLRAPMLNTRDEYVPSNRSGSDSRSAREPILASFNPIFSNSVGGAVPRSQITFTLDSAHRLIDVISSTPLTKISLSIVWCDEINECWPLVMNYRELIQCKICFHKKETYVG